MFMEKPEDDNDYTRYLSLIGTPLLLIIAPICGYFMGYWLDKYFNTAPYLSYIFLLLGVIAGIREFHKLIKEFGNNDQSKH